MDHPHPPDELTARGLTSVPGPTTPRSHSARPTCNGYSATRTTWASFAIEASSTGQARTTRDARDLAAGPGAPRLPATSPARSSASIPTTSRVRVYCGTCGSRLIVSHAKNRHGTVYPYFICVGRQQKRTDCRNKPFESIKSRRWSPMRTPRYASPQNRPTGFETSSSTR